jgi:hypothetical protein
MSKQGFIYELAQDEGLVLEFIRDLANDTLDGINPSNPHDTWYGICLDEEVGSTVALIYGREAAETILQLYQASMDEEE